MDLTDRIETVIRPTIEDMGFDVVRVQVLGRERLRVQVMAERTDGKTMTVDDCAQLSRAISPVLEVEDPVAGSYTFEVSSPGIDRPLVRLRDYERFAGFEAKIEMARPMGERRRFQGRLMGTDGEKVLLSVDGTEVALVYDDIRRAKLLLTEELLAMQEQ
jgi:ribosome maturation factor RimP